MTDKLTAERAFVMERSVSILGIRGIPASHGGFETFAENLAPYLVKRHWRVSVYCQDFAPGKALREDTWHGVRRIIVPVRRKGAAGTIEFDWRSTVHAVAERPAVVLTLGYNTALFCARLRFANIPNVINMDGIEWQRDKWRLYQKGWLWGNEKAACLLGNHLIADHPEIAKHLARRVSAAKISMIPYGAERIVASDPELLRFYGLSPGGYALLVARAEPENLILEVVRAFSRTHRGKSLVVVGKYQPDVNGYHAEVMNAASDEVRFLGAIYDRQVVGALRFHAYLYVHGHTVGGTNPSLVEALGAGSPILAHYNRFNRWVAGPGARYFRDENECARRFEELLSADVALDAMRLASWRRHAEEFNWDRVLPAYEEVLSRWAMAEGE